MRETGVLRRLPFALALITGVLMVGVIVGASQLDAARSGDEVLDGAAPFLTDDGLGTIQDDLARIETTFTQMAADPDFAAEVAGDPALSEAAARLPAAQALAEKVVGNLDQRQGQFDSAAALPGLGLDLLSAVVGLLVLAVIVVIAGGVGLVRPSRWAAVVVLLAGVAVAGTPLALGHLDKARDTDALLDSLRPFSVEKVEARQDGLADVALVFHAYDGTAVPAEDLAETAAAIDRFEELVEFSEDAQPLLVDATTMSATTTAWLSIGEGAALALAGGVGLLTTRRADRSRPSGTGS